MANTFFEQTGGTYTQVGDYMLPNLLPAEEEKEANIGVWGMRHKRYLKQNHKVIYYNLLTSGKLNSYLTDIEQQAQHLFSRLVKDLAEKENVTEKLKANDMMLWVQKMNNIRNRAAEIVNAEIVYIA
ncbi:TnpV protein [uncultured Ruminococcus sp.]|uniref:TnpV protein n=1 Tax=uncultured Ruminococcus sp. TaxID=165186 RepID=UPI00266F82A0|nr:TnpV protein [uncultured Ruminococcus sp.]